MVADVLIHVEAEMVPLQYVLYPSLILVRYLLPSMASNKCLSTSCFMVRHQGHCAVRQVVYLDRYAGRLK